MAAGKAIDIKKYVKTNEKNYQNSLSKMGLKISKMSQQGVKSVVEGGFKLLGKLAS